MKKSKDVTNIVRNFRDQFDNLQFSVCPRKISTVSNVRSNKLIIILSAMGANDDRTKTIFILKMTETY